MLWWKNDKPSPASYIRRESPQEQAERLRTERRRHEQERYEQFQESARKSFAELNATMNARPEFGAHTECPACGENYLVREFRNVEKRAGDRPSISAEYNLMRVSCGECSYTLGYEKAKNFELPTQYMWQTASYYDPVFGYY